MKATDRLTEQRRLLIQKYAADGADIVFARDLDDLLALAEDIGRGEGQRDMASGSASVDDVYEAYATGRAEGGR